MANCETPMMAFCNKRIDDWARLRNPNWMEENND